MICRLCLCDSSNYFDLFDSYGVSVCAASIISKHFWFEPKSNDLMSNSVCFKCWDIVKSFHNLYEIVAKAHKILEENIVIKPDPCENDLLDSEEPIQNCCETKYNDFEWDNIDFEKLNVDLKSEKEDEFNDDKIFEDEHHTANIIEDKVLKDKLPTKIKRRRNRKKSNENNNDKQKKDKINNQDKESNANTDDSKLSDKTDKTNSKLVEEDKKISSFMKMICILCQTECSNFSTLRWHFITKHKQKGFVICCEKRFFKRSALVDHVEKHINPESFKCELCNKICISRWTLKLHVSRVHENTEAGHTCSFCGKSFKLKTILVRHQLIHMPEEEKKFKCDECGKRYPSHGTLLSHIRAYHDRRYAGMCDICGKTYNNKEDVRRHKLQVHEGVARSNIKCKQCSKEFPTKYRYNIHKVEEHGNPNQKLEHRCPHCDKLSANSEALKRHIQKVHKAKLKFFCNFCDKVFKTDLSLKEHETIHTGEPLYICPHCPRTFTHNSNMHHHRKRAHPVEFEEARQRKNEKKGSWIQLTAFPNQ